MTFKEETVRDIKRLDRKICCVNNSIVDLLSEDILAALNGANSPDGTNVFLTQDDLDNYDPITVVANYADLPAAATETGNFFWAEASQGTQWLPGNVGGTYYPLGIYYSNGVSWTHIESPYQATQPTVDAGSDNTKFVTSLTLRNSSQWSGKRDISTYTYKSALYTVANTDRTIECNGTFAITLPLLADITHREDITIKNSGVGIITIQTTGGELLEDTVTFPIYATESLTLQKGNTTYIAK